MSIIVCFRRDLRLNVNPAFRAALESGDTIIPVYVHDNDTSKPWQLGGASRWYLHHSLKSLQASLQESGHRLLYSKGNVERELVLIANRTNAKAIYLNRVYEPSQIKVDNHLKDSCTSEGIECKLFHDTSLFKPGTVLNKSGAPYKVFTPFWRALCTEINARGLPKKTLNKLQSCSKRSSIGLKTEVGHLDLLDTNPWHLKFHAHWTVGERAADKKWQAMLDKLAHYPEHRNVPALSGTSGLSAALHFGEITAWQLISDLWPLIQGKYGGEIASAAEALARQIGWREFALNLLYDNPNSDRISLQTRFDDAGMWASNPYLLHRWQNGETGVPLVDAGMKELWETGNMHNRVRMVVASFLTKNLGEHWLSGAKWFWDSLVDADLANNTMGWQWVAGCGCDAAPYYRIFNPERQAERFDPHQVYIERWLGSGNQSTPKVVDLVQSRDQALVRYQMMKS